MTKIIRIPQEITEELAEETGWHIGDGSMNYYKLNGSAFPRGFYQLRGHIEDDRDHYITRIKPIFKQLYDLDVSLREMPSTRVFGFQIWNNDLVKFKHALGLCLGKKWDITIPDVFLESDELKVAVLRGIFDTDGCIYFLKKKNRLYPRLFITTICPTLAQQIIRIFVELGFVPSTQHYTAKQKGNRVPWFKITVQGDLMLDRFMEVIKPQNPKFMKRYLFYMSERKLREAKKPL